MKLISLNVSLPREVPFAGRTVRTGIFKEPVAGRVLVRRLNLEGDCQADLSVHGGLNKAVYAYPHEHYAWWAEQLGRTDLAPGQFGENLTVAGLLEDAVHLGDVFQIGTARLQVTQPRRPCFKLGIRMGSPDFPRLFLASGRLGFYFRVLEEGEVAAGDSIQRIERSDDGISIHDLWQLSFGHRGNGPPASDQLRQALRCPTLGREWTDRLHRLLQDEQSRESTST